MKLSCRLCDFYVKEKPSRKNSASLKFASYFKAVLLRYVFSHDYSSSFLRVSWLHRRAKRNHLCLLGCKTYQVFTFFLLPLLSPPTPLHLVPYPVNSVPVSLLYPPFPFPAAQISLLRLHFVLSSPRHQAPQWVLPLGLIPSLHPHLQFLICILFQEVKARNSFS